MIGFVDSLSGFHGQLDIVIRMLLDWQNIYIVASVRRVIMNSRYFGLQFSAQVPEMKYIVLRLQRYKLIDSLLLGLYYKWTLLLFKTMYVILQIFVVKYAVIYDFGRFHEKFVFSLPEFI